MKPSMKAVVIHSYGGIEKIEIEEISTPLPQSNEVQIEIKYAGINPVDWKIASGMLKTRMESFFPIILGWDAAGIISAVGEKVKRFKVGDPVFAYCRKKVLHDGSFAEYICLDAENVSLKPSSLSFAEAAVIPLSCLTAWQSLYDTAHLKSNETILIHAGAGGVGGYAIQLAKRIGAYVITTASQGHHEYVKMMGADEVIDYTKERFTDVLHKQYPQGIDVVFDTVGEDTLRQSYEVIKKGGRLITIAGVVDQVIASEKQLKAEFVFVQPDGKQLQKIAELIDAGKLKVPRVQEVPFDEIESALRKSREGHTQGKLVLKI